MNLDLAEGCRPFLLVLSNPSYRYPEMAFCFRTAFMTGLSYITLLGVKRRQAFPATAAAYKSFFQQYVLISRARRLLCPHASVSSLFASMDLCCCARPGNRRLLPLFLSSLVGIEELNRGNGGSTVRRFERLFWS